MNYQHIVIGNGCDAVSAAVTAAGKSQRVALVKTTDGFQERVTGPALRQAAERLVKSGAISMPALRREVVRDVQAQMEIDLAELMRLNVDVFTGTVRLIDANTVAIQHDQIITGETIILACGTKSATIGQSCFDRQVVLAAEDLLSLEGLPGSMIVVGAGRIGLDHAVVLALLGVEVTVVDEHSSLFDLCGGLMGGALFEAQSLDIAFRLGDEVIGVERRSIHPEAAVRLASGRALRADAVLICIGREGRTEGMNLESAGVGLDEHGRVWCDASGHTWVPTITAIGDVIGFRPSLMAG